MRFLKLAAALLAAVFLHLVGVHMGARFSSSVDLFLVVLVYNALDGDALAGMLGGMAAGLVTDALTGGPYGLFGLTDTILGFAVAYATQRLVVQRAVSVLLLFVLAAAAQQAILTMLSLLLLPHPELSAFFWVVIKVASTGVLGLGAFVAERRLRAGFALWRRGRTSKLRFGRREGD